MRSRTLLCLLLVIGLLACLAHSTPCIKNTASPNEGEEEDEDEKGKDKRCIRQDAKHREVQIHYHHGGTYVINTNGTVVDPNGKGGKGDDKKSGKKKNDDDNKVNRKIAYSMDHPDISSKLDMVPKQERPHWSHSLALANNEREIRPWKRSPSAIDKCASHSTNCPLGHSKRASAAMGQVGDPGGPYPFNRDEVEAMKSVNVTIDQNGKDPIAINVVIRNNSKMNITIMTRNSVVDKDAFKLGYFRVYPDDTRINFAPEKQGFQWYYRPRGKWRAAPNNKPVRVFLESDLTHLKPGETIEQTMFIPTGTPKEKEQWLNMIRHAKKIKVRVQGKWPAIGAWKTERRWSRETHWEFRSNEIDLEITR
ncbi:hypothetical protein ACLX1H_004592 [Fusarium chlamydosporum]